MRELFGNARVFEELFGDSLGELGGLGDSFGVADDPFVADGKLPASAFAAASKYGPAIDCLHAGAEAVLFGALAVIRLKRSLRHIGVGGSASSACAQKRTGLYSQVKSLRTEPV